MHTTPANAGAETGKLLEALPCEFPQLLSDATRDLEKNANTLKASIESIHASIRALDGKTGKIEEEVTKWGNRVEDVADFGCELEAKFGEWIGAWETEGLAKIQQSIAACEKEMERKSQAVARLQHELQSSREEILGAATKQSELLTNKALKSFLETTMQEAVQSGFQTICKEIEARYFNNDGNDKG